MSYLNIDGLVGRTIIAADAPTEKTMKLILDDGYEAEIYAAAGVDWGSGGEPFECAELEVSYRTPEELARQRELDEAHITALLQNVLDIVVQNGTSGIKKYPNEIVLFCGKNIFRVSHRSTETGEAEYVLTATCEGTSTVIATKRTTANWRKKLKARAGDGTIGQARKNNVTASDQVKGILNHSVEINIYIDGYRFTARNGEEMFCLGSWQHTPKQNNKEVKEILYRGNTIYQT